MDGIIFSQLIQLVLSSKYVTLPEDVTFIHLFMDPKPILGKLRTKQEYTLYGMAMYRTLIHLRAI